MGTTARCQFRGAQNSGPALIEIVPVLSFPAIGQLLVRLDVAFVQTENAPGRYRGDVELTFPHGVRQTVEFLEITVLDDVTRSPAP